MSLDSWKTPTYCRLEFLYTFSLKRGINSRVYCCEWVLTLNISASSHSAKTIWPSCMPFSLLSCPFDGDKWISRIMQVRSPGVNNWLSSHVITFVLPWQLWTFILWVLTFDLMTHSVLSYESAYASQIERPTWCPEHIGNLSHGGRYARLTVGSIYLKGRCEVEENNNFVKDIKILRPRFFCL